MSRTNKVKFFFSCPADSSFHQERKRNKEASVSYVETEKKMKSTKSGDNNHSGTTVFSRYSTGGFATRRFPPYIISLSLHPTYTHLPPKKKFGNSNSNSYKVTVHQQRGPFVLLTYTHSKFKILR